MKWNIRALIVLFITINPLICFADNIQIIYGLEKAQHFKNSQQNKIFFIQVGSFLEHAKALRLQKTLKEKTNHPVQLTQKGDHFTVMIGPLYSLSEVKNIATHLSEPLSVSTSKHKYFADTTWLPAMDFKTLLTNHWFTSIGIGGQFPTTTSPMLVNNHSNLPAPYYQDTYTLNTQNGAIIALAAGYYWEQNTQWLPSYSLGAQWQHFFSINPNGTVLQYSAPEFNNYQYSWDVDSNVLLAIAKLNITQYQRFLPYINGGIGLALNHTENYKEQAFAEITPRDTPGFTPNTATQFAYQLGAGIDFQVSSQILLSLGYNYQSIGKLISGPGLNTWTNQSLNSETIGTNEILFTVNYLFGK